MRARETKSKHLWLVVALMLAVVPVGARAMGAVDEGLLAHGAPRAHVPGVALVKLKDVSTHRLRWPRKGDVEARAVLDEIAARTGVRLTFERMALLGYGVFRMRHDDPVRGRLVPDEDETAEMIARLVDDPAISRASVDGWARVSATPNDPYYGNMWHLQIVNAATAWDTTTGLSSQRVGVVDTGLVREHQDLSAKDVAGYDFISFDGVANDGDGRDASYDDPGDAGDCGGGFMSSTWHGTHVAGTLAASANNGTGVAGVNWQAGLVSARALGVCGGDAVDIMSGAAWMVGADIDGVPALAAVDRVQVVNLSLSGARLCSAFEQDVVDFIDEQGAVVVAAAGNEASTVGAPANCERVIAVGAFGPGGNRASYSNWGPEIDVVGPGGDFAVGDAVYSAVGPGTSAYTAYEGTSMAAPHVAGAISLAHALDPTLTRADVVALFDQGVTCGGCDGVPALQLDRIVEAVTTGGTTPPPGPTIADDAYEENDTFDSGTPIGCGMTITAYAKAQDFDFYRMAISSGATLTATLSATNGHDLDLYVVKGMQFSTDVLAASESETGSESLTFTADATPIAILVNPFFDSTTNDGNADGYTLAVSCTGNTTPPPTGATPTDPAPVVLTPDVFEPNDDAAAPASLACGASEDATMQDDEDWFAVDVEDATALSVMTRGATGPVPVEIRTSTGERVIATGEGAASQLLAEAEGLAAGRYLVRVTKGAAHDAYRVAVTCAVDEMGLGGCSHAASRGGAPHGALALIALALIEAARRRRPTRRRR